MSFEPVFKAIAREEDELRASAKGHERIREALVLFDPPTVSRQHRRTALAFSAATIVAAAAAIALFLGPLQEQDALSVSLGSSGDRASVGALIGAPETQALPLHFSDGTEIDMMPGARARLVELDAHGAHLHIENGKANVRVVHRPAASWRLTMGPFAVKVTGTRFDVRWDAEHDQFELALQEGQVVLSGCVFGDGKPLTAGQTVRASCTQKQMQLGFLSQAAVAPIVNEAVPPTATGPQKPAPEPSAPEPPAAAEQNLLQTAAQPIRPRSLTKEPSAHERAIDSDFRELAKRGKYVEAFAAAERAGFETVCAKAGADELLLLGDSARYAGHSQKASYAFKLLRTHFPRSNAATLAAFALGRLEFDGRGSYHKAAEWFRAYLSEQPSGPLSREARGRLMEALFRAREMAAAKEIAAQYLKAYPSGPHAALAKRIQAE